MSKQKVKIVKYIDTTSKPIRLTYVDQEVGMYMYDRYKIQTEMGEHGANEYKIISNDDLSVVEVYDNKSEAEDALKFWNQ